MKPDSKKQNPAPPTPTPQKTPSQTKPFLYGKHNRFWRKVLGEKSRTFRARPAGQSMGKECPLYSSLPEWSQPLVRATNSKCLLYPQYQQLSISAVVYQHEALTPTASKRVFIYLFFILLKFSFLHPSNLSENLCSWIWSKFFNK